MSSLLGIGSVTSTQLPQRLGDGQNGLANRMDQAVNTALQAMGVDSSKTASITKQIETAVQAAAKSSDGANDPRAAMQQAVDGVLQKNGIDPQQFKTQFQAAMKKQGGTKQARPPQAAAPKQAANTPSTPQEEAIETYADTLKEARAGDRQAIKKLAADDAKAAAARGQAASGKKEAETNGEAPTTAPGKENGINVTA